MYVNVDTDVKWVQGEGERKRERGRDKGRGSERGRQTDRQRSANTKCLHVYVCVCDFKRYIRVKVKYLRGYIFNIIK